jgi:hypothetical protein
MSILTAIFGFVRTIRETGPSGSCSAACLGRTPPWVSRPDQLGWNIEEGQPATAACSTAMIISPPIR